MAVNVSENEVARAREFIQKVQGDPQLLQKVTAAPTLEEKGEIAAQAGFPDLTLNGIQAAATEMTGGQATPEGTRRARELLKQLGNDPDLARRMEQATTLEAKQQVLQDTGYGDVTVADFKAVTDSVTQAVQSGEELSDEDLELVSGGLWTSTMSAIGKTITMTVSAGSTIGAIGGPKGAAVGAAVGLAAGIGLGFAQGVPQDQAAGRKACYVVDATQAALGRPQDWATRRMTMLVHRAVGRQPLGQAILQEYDVDGPKVVEAISRRPNAREIYEDIDRRLVQKNMELVRDGREAEAGRNFVEVVRGLQRRYVLGEA